MVESEACSTG